MNGLNIKQIQEIIPHRHPFLLIDFIEDFKPGEYAVGYKCVTYREEFFRGHFPQEPVMPGVLTIEALARSCPKKKIMEKLPISAEYRNADSVEKLFPVIKSDWKQRSSNKKERSVSVKRLPMWTENWL